MKPLAEDQIFLQPSRAGNSRPLLFPLDEGTGGMVVDGFEVLYFDRVGQDASSASSRVATSRNMSSTNLGWS